MSGVHKVYNEFFQLLNLASKFNGRPVNQNNDNQNVDNNSNNDQNQQQQPQQTNNSNAHGFDNSNPDNATMNGKNVG